MCISYFQLRTGSSIDHRFIACKQGDEKSTMLSTIAPYPHAFSPLLSTNLLIETKKEQVKREVKVA